ncbi:MAG: PQQ-binding-like beta-propeller repeat protein, partial [candidate division WOR-3 bacterium]
MGKLYALGMILVLLIGCREIEEMVDIEPPIVEITHPVDGSYVDSTVFVIARATDNEIVDSIEIHIDTLLVAAGADTIVTYEWETEILIHGTVYKIFAIAFDGEENVGISDTVTVTVEHTGTLKWRWYAGYGADISSPAIAGDGTVYFGASAYPYSVVYALNPDGTFKWLAYVGWSSTSPAVGSDGTVYIGSEIGWPDGRLYAFYPNGNEKWHYETSRWIASPPALAADGTIYFGCADSHCYALNPEGTLRWRYETGNEVDAPPSVAMDGTVYFGSDDGYLYALNPDGILQWSYYTGSAIESGAALGSDGSLHFGCNNGYMYVLNPDGTLQWQYQTGAAVKASPT